MTPRFAVLAAVLVAAGCGDGPICPSAVVVVISSPTDGVAEDVSDAEGVQIDVEVRSNLRAGDSFTLDVSQDGGDPASYAATADADGGALFEAITVPNGTVTLAVTGASDQCGSAEDTRTVQVANQNCVVSITEVPTPSDFYGVPVLNTGHDTDGSAAGFQGNAAISTTTGYTVELFIAAPAEVSQGTVIADAEGTAGFALSLAEGLNTLRAVCTVPGGGSSDASAATVVFVDTVVPACTVEPAAGTTIVPSMDLDDDSGNGTQVMLMAHAAGGDVTGEPAEFIVDGTGLLTPALDAGGDTQVSATFDTPSPPDTPVSFMTQDHAGNACHIDRAYAYQTAGCDITITDPAGPITIDANGNPADGLQYDLAIMVDPACAGQTVTTDCDVDGPASAVVPGDGQLTMRVTLCTSANCPDSRVCSASVTNSVGVETSDGVTLEIDLAGIVVTFDANIADGLITSLDGGVTVIGQNALLDICGTVDVTGATVSISIDGGTPQAAVVNGTSWCRSNVTLIAGTHTLGVATTDGVAMGGNQIDPLTVDVVGPTNPTAALVVAVDREAARFSWTAPENGGPTTAAASYVVKASTTAFTTGNFDGNGTALAAPAPSLPGQSDQVVATRLRAGTPYYFVVVAVDAFGNRSGLAQAGPHEVDFTRSGRIDPILVSNDRGWDGFGQQVAGGDFDGDGIGDVAVAAPYTDTSTSVDTFADGVVYLYRGADDGSGIDATQPTFVIQADPSEQTGRFGVGLAVLDWNGDGTDDLAVGAPFQKGGGGRVSIFYGGAGFAPGSASLPVTLVQNVDADLQVETDRAGSFFTSGRCGFALAAGRFDSADQRDDLAMSCILADGGRGGVLVLHGGASTPATIVLSDSDTSQMGDLRVHRITFSGEPANSSFGRHLHALAPTGGATDETNEVAVVPVQSVAPNRVYVFRGRASAPAPGISTLAFDPTLDLQLSDGIEAASSRFGDTMGTVGDLDGDGRRELVIPDHLATGGGYVTIVRGDATGSTTVAAVEVVRIAGGGGVVAFGSAVVNNRPGDDSDIDGDGIDDLVVGGRTGGDFLGHLYIWYGDTIPTSGTVTAAASADHVIAAPSTAFNQILTAGWAGDIDGDGLADLCYGDPDSLGGKIEALHR